MFYTLTANPAVDMTVSSSPLEPDENVRTGSASYTANGKGLDVSFAFKKMGVDTVALGFFAGFTGKFIVEEVMNLGCLCRPVWTDGITRINTYVNDGQHEYGILNPGAPITPQHQEELYNILDTAGDLECLIVSGSVPPKATPDFWLRSWSTLRLVAPMSSWICPPTSSRSSLTRSRCSSSRTITR